MSDSDEIRGMIFDIERFAVHDGPGIRTVVFLKGCPLRCLWCHNPESIRKMQELFFFESRCIDCGNCFEVCATGAHKISNGEHIIDRALCNVCGRCARVCDAEALTIVGKRMTVGEVITEVEKDRTFYETSGGGVTLSGGEPAYQKEFSLALLKECKEGDLHTVIDTSGYVREGILKGLLEYVDLVLYDLKCLDPDKHLKFTGVPNELILNNAKVITDIGKAVIFRAPIVPGYNDSDEDIRRLGEFVENLKGDPKIELLPYHRLAEDKYRRLGRPYPLKGLLSPKKEHMEKLADDLRSYDIEVLIGGR